MKKKFRRGIGTTKKVTLDDIENWLEGKPANTEDKELELGSVEEILKGAHEKAKQLEQDKNNE